MQTSHPHVFYILKNLLNLLNFRLTHLEEKVSCSAPLPRVLWRLTALRGRARWHTPSRRPGCWGPGCAAQPPRSSSRSRSRTGSGSDSQRSARHQLKCWKMISRRTEDRGHLLSRLASTKITMSTKMQMMMFILADSSIFTVYCGFITWAWFRVFSFYLKCSDNHKWKICKVFSIYIFS